MCVCVIAPRVPLPPSPTGRTIVMYLSPCDATPKSVFVLDSHTNLHTFHTSTKRLTLANARQSLELHFHSEVQWAEWVAALRAGVPGAVTPNLNTSFAPPRDDVTASWLVEGRTHFAAVAHALMSAAHSIFIGGVRPPPCVFVLCV